MKKAKFNKLSFFFIVCFLLPFYLLAEVKTTNFVKQDIAQASKPPEGEAGPHFKGLILVSKKADLNPMGYQEVQGVMAYHVDLPGNIVKLKKEVRTYYHHPLNTLTLKEIKKGVVQFYQKANRPIISVIVPEQDISSGVLQMIVVEGKLGKVYASGNKWFKSDKIEESIELEPGENIASDLLNQNLYWLNRNPFRHVDVIYTPGEEEGTTDIELAVKDRFPLRLYGGIDNTGNDVTGNNRLFTGLNWGNVFGTDQRLAYQFVSSSDFKRLQAHTLFYEIPLPWQHLLNIYGGYSQVDAKFRTPDIKGMKFRTHGFSLQGSLRYDLPLKPLYNFLHEMTAGFDFKRTNNNLELGGQPIISQNNVNLAQFQLGYNMGYEKKTLSLSFEFEGFYSPGTWMADQTKTDYHSLRAYSKTHYVYARSAFTAIWKFFKEWSVHNYLRAQLASINLLPSEQYGVGGYNTIRGYKERIVNGDNAFLWNFELRTPSISILNPLAGWKKFHDEFQVLAFFDYGYSVVKQPVEMQSKASYLMSCGPGVRYTVAPYLTLRADWGFQLHNLHLAGPYQRLHFALIVGY